MKSNSVIEVGVSGPLLSASSLRRGDFAGDCGTPGKRCFSISKMVSALSSKISLFSKLTAGPQVTLAQDAIVHQRQKLQIWLT
ncbi:hypothetical protein SDJN02_24246, partial [Cucurbita argyrosperma subsp. argyrosperma]